MGTMTGQELREDRLARAALTCIAEPGDTMLYSLISRHGPAQVLAKIRAGTVQGLPGYGSSSAARRTPGWQGQLRKAPGEDMITRLAKAGTRLICPGDEEWPARLDALGEHRPVALWARGAAPSLAAACEKPVAIVGSRAATAYGSYVAAELAASLAAAGWTVISGGAYGIDGAAHRGALASRGATVAVMACGVDRPYPAGHAELLDAIAVSGVIVSEYPPGSPPSRQRFLARNRLIAALAGGVVVVEAGQRSGALSTARHARELGRPVMAVPGPVTSAASHGCHDLIRSGALLITSAQQVVDAIAPAPGTRVSQGAVTGETELAE